MKLTICMFKKGKRWISITQDFDWHTLVVLLTVVILAWPLITQAWPALLLFILGELLSPSLCFTSLTLCFHLCFIITQAHTLTLFGLSFVFVHVEREESLSLYVHIVLSPNLFLLNLDIFYYNSTTQVIVVFSTNSIHPLTHYSRS